MQNTLRFYVNLKSLNTRLSYSPLLFPFLGSILKSTTPFYSSVFQKHNFSDKYYTIVSDNIESADFVFVPHNYWLLKEYDPRLLNEFIQEARIHKKRILIDAYGDSDDHIPVDDACILRTSQYRFKLRKNEVIIPAYTEDLLESYRDNTLILRNKNPRPLIGFVGWADAGGQRRLSQYKDSFLKLLSRFDKEYGVLRRGVFLRAEVLFALNRCHLIDTNFIIRRSHSGHIKTAQGDLGILRSEFVKNIVESDYTLCVKGNGNYSVRFYETLSLGRIPLLLDTDCVLPLEDIVNYEEFCVFVDHRDIHRIGEILYDFHRTVAPDRFTYMQRRARYVFENYLRIDNFTRHLVEKLRIILETARR